MPRPLRHWVPGGIYHLTARGNNRQAVFLDDVDHQRYLIELRQCREHVPFRLLAFALMPNHVHLVAEAVPDASLSAVMHRVGKNYAHYFNHRYGRVGHVYQGRFYSSFVNRESYLLEVTRYVHLNPVRARLCRRPGEYPWSSYRCYAGLAADPLGLVHTERILSLFGATGAGQVEAYQRFVEGRADDEEEMRRWIRQLERKRLVPPARWLKVPRTFPAL